MGYGLGFDVIVAAVAVIAGSIASVAGFGIGSILTPLIAVQYGMKSAVSAVAVPHVIATAIRFWRMRAHVDRRVLAGAILHARVTSPLHTYVLAAVLIVSGGLGLTGYAGKLRFGRAASWVAGAVSGAFGGLVGNQGGIRSAAMLGLGVQKEAFVATATAIALCVDAVRIPVYFATGWQRMLIAWPVILYATAGVVVGTLAGVHILRRIPERVFRRVIAGILLVVGIALLSRGPAPGQ